MKCFAGVWIASLPKEMEERTILGVEFISPKVIDMKIWRPSFSPAHYTPDSMLFKGRTMKPTIGDLHLARTQVKIEDTSLDKLIEIAKEVVYPRIRRACLIVDAVNRTGHVYVSPEIIIRLNGSAFSTWVGRSSGRPQGEMKEDLLGLMEEVFSTCKDRSFLQRIERALVKWSEAQEEPREALRTAKLWSALDALLQKRGERVMATVSKRSIVLVMMESRESIDIFSMAGWRVSFDATNLDVELKKFLKNAYQVRCAVYHDAEEPAQRIGFALDLSSLAQVLILKIAEFAQRGYTWDGAVGEIDRKAQELGITRW